MVPGSALISTHHQPVPVGCPRKWYGGSRDQFRALTGGRDGGIAALTAVLNHRDTRKENPMRDIATATPSGT